MVLLFLMKNVKWRNCWPTEKLSRYPNNQLIVTIIYCCYIFLPCYYDVISNVSNLVLFHLLHSLRSLSKALILPLKFFFQIMFVSFIPQVFQKLWMSLCNNASSSSGK